MRIRRFFKVALVNLVLVYVGLFAANLFLDYTTWRSTAMLSERQRIEATARAVDTRFFAQCLAKDHVQVFFPDLVSRQQRFRDLASKNRFLPLGPIPHVQTAYCNEGYGFATYRSDRFGFRNPDENWNQSVDALIVGDSFVHGACVPDPFSFARQVSSDIGINALTIGTASNSPNHYRHLINTFTALTKPRHVILAFFPNDNVTMHADDPYSAPDVTNDQASYAITGVSAGGRAFYDEVRPLLEPSLGGSKDPLDCRTTDMTFQTLRPLIVRDHLVGGSSASFGFFVEDLRNKAGHMRGLATLRALRNAVTTGWSSSPPILLDSPDTTRMAIDALFNQCRDDCKPVLVLMPTSTYWRPDPRANAYFEFILDHVKRVHGGKPMHLVDARTLIDEASLSDFAPVGPHFSTDAYRRIGIAIGQAVSQR